MSLASIASWEEGQAFAKKLRERSQRLVFTNGCFDLLHPGHVHYLEEARALGDALILGLNTDESIRRLKGDFRPIVPLEARAYVISRLECVDMVCAFGEDTPLDLIQAINPDILVKGGDYTLESIVGAAHVLENGGEVRVLEFIPGYSTTALIQKIKSL